jgi:peptidoglycan/LPS O-acetylase OafA/YrhL
MFHMEMMRLLVHSAGKKYSLLNRILAIMLVLIAVFAFLDGKQEDGLSYGVIGACLAVVAPALCWGVAFQGRQGKRRNSLSYAVALLVAVIGLLAYTFYVINGPSDPDTAGHMHVVLFPILYLIAAMIINLPLLLFDAFRWIRDKPGN